MKNRDLRTAVIGLGRIGWGLHVPHVVKTEGFTLCAVVDMSEERLAEAKETYGVPGYTSLHTMLAEARPDLLVIASPTHLHLAHAKEALEAGVNVFLDKPMAKDLPEAEALAAVQKKTGKKLMMFQPHRLFPEAQALRQILQEGLLGDIYLYRRTMQDFVRRNDWQTLEKYGGGMLTNNGPHFIDQALYLLGAAPDKVSCHRFRVASLGDAEDVSRLLIETDTRTLIDIDINMAAAFTDEPWTVYGTLGTARLTTNESGDSVFRARYLKPEELPALALQDHLAAAGRRYRPEDNLIWHTRDILISDMPTLNFYDFCYDFFALDNPPLVPLSQSLDVMRVIEQGRAGSTIATFAPETGVSR